MGVFFLAFLRFLCYLIGMLDKKVKQFIEDQGMILVLSHVDTGLCLWEDVGGHVWTLDMIEQAVK